MPYAKINPTGCGIHKNRIKLRLDFYLMPNEPNYDKTHVYVADETSKAYQEGYKGELNNDGVPVAVQDYQAWLDSLPRVWIDTPFHTHFIYPDKDADAEIIKADIERSFSYFYQFHQHCWNKELNFIDEWKKVPSKTGEVRCPFAKGNIEDLLVCEAKVQDILSRLQDITCTEVQSSNLNIDKKGTIDVGSPAIDRPTYRDLHFFGYYYTWVEEANAANADGTIDTVECYFFQVETGNSVKFGTFQHLGSNVLKCHDAEEYGEVFAGSKQSCTGLSIDISSGEYIGIDVRAPKDVMIDAANSGGVGNWQRQGQYCDPNDQATFIHNSSYILSLYGTGTELAPTETIVAKEFPMGYYQTTGVKELRSKVSGATIAEVAKNFPHILEKSGKAKTLISKWS